MISVQNMNDLKDLCKHHLFSVVTITPNIIASKGEWEVVWIFNPTDEGDEDMIYEVSFGRPHNTLAEWYKSWQDTRKDDGIELFVPVAIVKDVATKFPVLIFFGSLGNIEYVYPIPTSNDIRFGIIARFNMNLIMDSSTLKFQKAMEEIVSNLITDLYVHMRETVYKCVFAAEKTGVYATAVSKWLDANIS